MLRSLHIENIAVIRRVDIDFSQGFSVITGETGAGKSIMIDSINLLLGNRSSRELIRSGESMATVSAVFEELSPAVCQALAEMGFPCEDATLMLQRTVYADGKSKTRIDGQTVTQSVQREIARMLISIHGQSDHQRLLQKSAHAELLDAYAHPEEELAAYRKVYQSLKEVRKKLASIALDEAEKLRMREILQFQISDIDAMKLKDGEEETLTRERDRLCSLERINRQSELAYRLLASEKGAHTLVNRAESALRTLGDVVEGAEALADRLSAVASELEDVAESAVAFVDDDREDPTARIDRIEGRLEGISKLKRKYGAAIADILAFRERAREKLDELDSGEERAELLTKEAERLTAEAERLATILTEKRRQAAASVTKEVTEALTFLDMPRVRFEIAITPVPLGENGADEIEFLIATNAGEPLQPMIRIASGGELSRIMLALRSVINDRDGAGTVIFDEIDTGVSGKTSRKIGIKLKESAKSAQVLCVTHSAQIASLADTHYLITKQERDGRAETSLEELCEEARVEEIARILGGLTVTDTQRSAAREMMGLSE
ncbi:MAG: DNA repair protein RecN [Clostridia bacterium]|nr:DNA repair protein RecN [Clostridia bacterium]